METCAMRPSSSGLTSWFVALPSVASSDFTPITTPVCACWALMKH